MVAGVPIKFKSPTHIQEAAEAMLVEFNRYWHKFTRFTTAYAGHSDSCWSAWKARRRLIQTIKDRAAPC